MVVDVPAGVDHKSPVLALPQLQLARPVDDWSSLWVLLDLLDGHQEPKGAPSRGKGGDILTTYGCSERRLVGGGGIKWINFLTSSFFFLFLPTSFSLCPKHKKREGERDR